MWHDEAGLHHTPLPFIGDSYVVHLWRHSCYMHIISPMGATILINRKQGLDEGPHADMAMPAPVLLEDWDLLAAELNAEWPLPPLAFFGVHIMHDGLPGIVLVQPNRGGA